MRILMVSNWLPPVQAGSSYYASSLAKLLKARGHEILVLTIDWGADYQPDREADFEIVKLPIIKLPRIPLFYKLNLMGMACYPKNWARFKKILKDFRPDVIYQVNHIFDTTFLSAGLARRFNIPIAGAITTPIQHQNPWMQALMGFADRLLVGPLGVKKWDAVVSLDRTVHEYVGKVYGLKTQKKSRIIPFGVRLRSMPEYETRSETKAGNPQILMTGHIHPFRNPVQLIRAMPHVLKEFPNTKLILAGRVDLAEPVKAAEKLGLLGASVNFLGETQHSEVIRLLKTSHIFASWVTGPYKSLGTAPMEAMLCETAVINDLPEDLFGSDTLRHGKNIYLVDSKDPESIAKGILDLLRHEELRRAISRGGRDFVLNRLNWESIAAQVEDLCGEMTAKREKSILYSY